MSGYRIVVWSGPDLARNVVGRAKALTFAQEQARARGRTTAVYPEGENGVSGDRVARCDPDGTMEVYGPEHWQEDKPATMGAQRAKTRRFRVAYFGWSAEFTSAEVNADKLRAEANRIVLEAHGPDPSLSYVEPGLPFPAYVPVDVWEGAAKGFQPYL